MMSSKASCQALGVMLTIDTFDLSESGSDGAMDLVMVYLSTS